MPSGDQYRRKAEALLRQAAGAADMAERGRLVDEALHWHNLALDAHHRGGRSYDGERRRPADPETA